MEGSRNFYTRCPGQPATAFSDHDAAVKYLDQKPAALYIIIAVHVTSGELIVLAGVVTGMKEIMKPLNQSSAYLRARDIVTLFKRVKTQYVGMQS